MGGGTGRPAAVAFVRPLLILAAGAMAGAGAWWVLMHEPTGPSPVHGRVEERFVPDDRLALDHPAADPVHRTPR